MYYYFDDIIKIEDFNLDYFLIDMKEHIKIFYFITFHTKSWLLNLYVLDLIKYMDLLDFMIELDVYYYLEMKNLIPFTTRLDV